jgi:hypothetical protein
VNDKQISVHWSELPADDLTRFWQDVDAGTQIISSSHRLKNGPAARGEHSTKAKCENPSWFRPEHYKSSPELGHAYNRLVMFDKATGQPGLRTHISRHPLYVAGRRKAGRKYGFRPERQRLNDALWPLLVSFCDGGKHSVGLCVSRLAEELSPKDAQGNIIPKRR